MKKSLIIAAVFMLSFTAILKAQQVSGVSRRMQGINPQLVGVVSDEYSDFMLINTANILDIDGYRVYTQLSNLGIEGSDTALSGDAADNDFLLGGVMPMEFGKLGGFLINHIGRADAPIYYYDPSEGNILDSGHSGEFETIVKNGIDTEESGEAYLNENEIIVDALLGMKRLDFGHLGFRLSYKQLLEDGLSSKYSFTSRDEEGSLLSDIDDENEAKRKNTNITVTPSFRTLIDETVIGAILGVSLVTELDTDERISSFRASADNENYEDYYEHNTIIDSETELSGLGINIGGGLLHPLTENINLRGFATLGITNLSGDEAEYFEEEMIQGTTDPEIVKYSELSKQEIDENIMDISIISGIEKQISEKLMLGAGIHFHRNTKTTEMEEKRTKTDDDGVITYDTMTTDMERKISITNFSLPIGLEWQATEWMKARMGASYVINSYSRTDKYETTFYEDNTEEAEKEDDTIKAEETRPVIVTDNVAFFSGLGFSVTENLDIDVTGMFDNGASILELGNWELSATLKF